MNDDNFSDCSSLNINTHSITSTNANESTPSDEQHSKNDQLKSRSIIRKYDIDNLLQ
jgi:hypothetical protein